MDLPGTPSDHVEGILATGRTDVTTVFVSMNRRHPDGGDADYLAWHSLDHRPEQYRLPALRGSLRLVSTPACRQARAVEGDELDAVDHVMTYLFAEAAGLAGFDDLSVALRGAGRTPQLLPGVDSGVYALTEIAAAPGVKVGADVLPWWPAAGVYLLVEPVRSSVAELVDVPGVAGTWSAVATPPGPGMPAAPADQQITYCFLDDDPVATGHRLRPVLRRRWQLAGTTPRLAAPFHVVVPREWDRYLP